MVFNFHQQLLHGEYVLGDVQGPDRHQKSGVVKAHQLPQHLPPKVKLSRATKIKEYVNEC